MTFTNLPDLGPWTSAIHTMISAGMLIMAIAAIIGLTIKAALIAANLATKLKCRLSAATQRR